MYKILITLSIVQDSSGNSTEQSGFRTTSAEPLNRLVLPKNVIYITLNLAAFSVKKKN